MSGQFEKHPFLLPSTDVAAALKTDVDNGLTPTQVAQLQKDFPPNELNVDGGIAWHTILAKQLFNAMILGQWTHFPRHTEVAQLVPRPTNIKCSTGFCDHRLVCDQRLD